MYMGVLTVSCSVANTHTIHSFTRKLGGKNNKDPPETDHNIDISGLTIVSEMFRYSVAKMFDAVRRTNTPQAHDTVSTPRSGNHAARMAAGGGLESDEDDGGTNGRDVDARPQRDGAIQALHFDSNGSETDYEGGQLTRKRQRLDALNSTLSARQVVVRSGWEREVKRRPELTVLDDVHAERFLESVREYNLALASEDRDPVPLRMMIHPDILPAMQQFVRNMGVRGEEGQLPTDDELGLGDTPVDPAEATGRIQQWDEIVRPLLQRLARIRQGEATNSSEKIRAILGGKLVWDEKEPVLAIALTKFTSAFIRLDRDHGIRAVFPERGESGKSLVRLLTDRLGPDPFRAQVRQACLVASCYKFEDWCDIILEKEALYTGIVLGRSSTDSANPRNTTPAAARTATNTFDGIGAVATQLAKPNTHASGRKTQVKRAVRAKASSHSVRAAFVGAGRGGGKGGHKASGRHTPGWRQSGAPPRPCSHCGGPHWGWQCPKRRPERPCRHCGAMHMDYLCERRPAVARSARLIHPTRTVDDQEWVLQARRGSAHHAAGGSSDGTLTIGDVVVPFVFDSGATQTMVSTAFARQMLWSSRSAVQVDLPTPARVTVASGEALVCTGCLLHTHIHGWCYC